MTDISITPLMLGVVPVVIALVQLGKQYMSAKWLPLVALILGIGGAYLVTGNFGSDVILQGLLVGLSSIGLFSGARATIF